MEEYSIAAQYKPCTGMVRQNLRVVSEWLRMWYLA
ncbi:unnamed protein product [Nippostrongylus brasiliensis]|uniref:Uncharacterized protein n=1 Tax=Nippostrongylus brasiliensis TaxID=27835 RepID=A0A0N4XNJ0_NIPBR|nr:unnamed protein product [Nippostrongylus brasiliensis]